MYKLLLCWRYLRTRWIALASIVSVTLGVATLIVVNSVMDGFTSQMQDRMHGILSDLVVETRSTAGLSQPDWYIKRIHERLGDSLSGVTTVVTLPAMMTFTVNGQSHTQQINLIGIDESSYADVSDFSKYLLHPSNQKQLDFRLQESGYDPARDALQPAGWEHRRYVEALKKENAKQQRLFREEMDRYQQLQKQIRESQLAKDTPDVLEKESASAGAAETVVEGTGEEVDSRLTSPSQNKASLDLLNQNPSISSAPTQGYAFDGEKEQHTGIVLGIGLGSIRGRDQDGKVKDHFYLRPGDDVSVAFPNAGTPPRAIDQSFTIVDFYESKMSEYDATFAFVPIQALQKARGMIDPQTGMGAVTSIQIKLKPNVDLAMARDALRAEFPPESMVSVNSWKDTQGPLLAAVAMETTILNILLFMIIAVAGFGILATFFMIVVEKTRDIGVLKSLGAPGTGIAAIFLGYGVLLGSVGAGVGLAVGLVFVWKINEIARVVEFVTGREVFDPTVYYFDKIPTIVHPTMLVWVSIGSVLIAVLASVLPSIRAARMHPVEALRYE
ncbi:Lipoprotein-releasing system transmembrane protein LolE [Pirellula sp. SH-Sr6A]|uniref:ABC transporter permease n=1 Tax=Pirellula sp. SH-Sr6A TaxID=1632865 RepID=UPI00078E8DE3|nr:FtsX-like permease family protein [Pirellula sp. SH-Sr6A]AMV35138.1 Lipoprotein-releasing system transmembrane protein LolE [Pirellula sp. SH-Sr6A]